MPHAVWANEPGFRVGCSSIMRTLGIIRVHEVDVDPSIPLDRHEAAKNT